MNSKNEIVNSIKHLTCVIDELKIKVAVNKDYDEAYNKLLLQRAMLRQKLQEPASGKFLSMLKDNLQNLSPIKKEKRICDYFTTGKL